MKNKIIIIGTLITELIATMNNSNSTIIAGYA